jgi:hypothetical protein
MATEIENLQAQIDDIKAKLCAVGTLLSDYCVVEPKVEIPKDPFLHLDGSKYIGSGNWIDQTGRGLDGVPVSAATAPVYDAVNKCFNFDVVAHNAFKIDVKKHVTSIPGMSAADFAKMSDPNGTQQLGYQLNAKKSRTFATWVKFKPFAQSVIPGYGKIVSQYVLGFGRNESGYLYSLGSTWDTRPMLYNGNYDGWTSFTDPQVGTNNYQKQEMSTPFVDKWILMVATFDGTTNTIYIDDGETKQSWVPRSQINTIPDFFYVGRQPVATNTEAKFNESLSGSVGMVTVYNRALTADEVKQYFNATKATYKGK